MTFLGSGLSLLAMLLFSATIAGSWLCARVEPGERRAMGVQGPGEVY